MIYVIHMWHIACREDPGDGVKGVTPECSDSCCQVLQNAAAAVVVVQPQSQVDEIHNKGEGKAGKAAVHLAQFVYFRADVMRQNTAATLDVSKMREIKNIILAIKRCAQDKSALRDKCASGLCEEFMFGGGKVARW